MPWPPQPSPSAAWHDWLDEEIATARALEREYARREAELRRLRARLEAERGIYRCAACDCAYVEREGERCAACGGEARQI